MTVTVVILLLMMARRVELQRAEELLMVTKLASSMPNGKQRNMRNLIQGMT
uniref:Uncharacterized protein n=1 Tax=Rhizophora mucronata TaxID=61149 RepID=A0A2P2PR76_RHIMU